MFPFNDSILQPQKMKNCLLFLFLFPCCVFAQHAKDTVMEQPAQSVVIAQILLSGHKITNHKIILREMSIREGQVVAADSIDYLLQQNWERLFNIGLFTDIAFSVDTVSQDSIYIHIRLKERWYIIPEPTFQLADRNFNVWWTEQNRDIRRTIIGVTLRHKNFRGNLENLSATAQIGYTQKIHVDYSIPYLDKKQRHGAGISFGYAESEEIFYATDSNKLQFIKTRDRYIASQAEISLAYIYRPAYAARHLIRLSYKHFYVADTVLRLNDNYYAGGSNHLSLLELNYRLELNYVDNWNYPLRGTKVIGQLFAKMGLQGLQQQLYGTLEAGRFFQMRQKWYSSTIFRGRLSVPDHLPYAFRGALGTKYEYVRGYEYYVIDGYHYGILRTNIKYELLNLEIRKLPFRYLPVIPLRVYPKIFADAGYVQNPVPGNSFLNNRMLYSAGIGLDIFTAYDIKIRFEYAWNHLGQKGLFLHFNSE